MRASSRLAALASRLAALASSLAALAEQRLLAEAADGIGRGQVGRAELGAGIAAEALQHAVVDGLLEPRPLVGRQIGQPAQLDHEGGSVEGPVRHCRTARDA